MRRFTRGAAAAVGLASLVVAGTTAPAAAAPSAGGVGIRLLDAPLDQQNDPRAHEYLIAHLVPGTTTVRHIEVDNTTAASQVVQLYPAAANVAGGTFTFGGGHAPNDLTSWTTVAPAQVTVAAGGVADATVTVAVPAGVADGERYAVVWAELAPDVPAGGGITTVNRVGIRMYVSVGSGGVAPVTDFAVTALQARRDANGAPQVLASVANTGGLAVDLSGSLRLTDGPGALSAGPFAVKLGTTLGPGQSEPVTVSLDRSVPAGPWTADLTLQSGTTTRHATARLTFPAAAGESAPAVRARTVASPHSSLVPVLGGFAAVLLVLVMSLGWRHRRATLA